MAFLESRIGRVRVAEQASWGTAATVADANTIECEITYPNVVTEAISVDAIRGAYHSPTIAAGSEVGATFSMRIPMHGFSSATPTGTPAEHPDALLLKHAMGGSDLGGYAAAAADLTGGHASGNNITLANGTTGPFHVGSAIMVPVAGTTGDPWSVGWIQNLNSAGSDFLDFIGPMGAQAHTEGQIYGSNTCYVTNGYAFSPLTVRWTGVTSEASITLFDCVVTSCKVTANPKEQCMLEVELFARQWTNDGAGGAPGVYAQTFPQLRVAMDNAVGSHATTYTRLTRHASVGAETTTAIHAFSFEMDITTSWAQIGSHNAPQGVHRFHPTNREIALSVVSPCDDTCSTDVPGTSRGSIQLDLVSSPGQSLSILLPSAILAEQETVGDQDGVVATTSSYVAGSYTSDTVSTNAANSIARIAFL